MTISITTKAISYNTNIGSNISLFIVSAEPAKCETDKDCLKEQAKCIRRECHCTEKYAFGDGKTKCESKCKSLWNKQLSQTP